VDSATSELVFAFNVHNFYNLVFQPALKRAGIADFRWHDLRHTFASRLVQRGVPLYTVQRLLGHQSISMTERYAHLAPDDLLAAVTKLCATSTATNCSAAGVAASVEMKRNLNDDRRESLVAAVGIEPTT
jgi:hypothetical protein